VGCLKGAPPGMYAFEGTFPPRFPVSRGFGPPFSSTAPPGRRPQCFHGGFLGPPPLGWGPPFFLKPGPHSWLPGAPIFTPRVSSLSSALFKMSTMPPREGLVRGGPGDLWKTGRFPSKHLDPRHWFHWTENAIQCNSGCNSQRLSDSNHCPDRVESRTVVQQITADDCTVGGWIAALTTAATVCWSRH